MIYSQRYKMARFMLQKFKIILIIVLLFNIVVMSGCSQKVAIRALEPALIDRAASTKKVSVAAFSNDKIGLSHKIEANLFRQKIDEKNYFTVISRKDFDKIIKEQKIQNSGLVYISTTVQVGNLLGAQAIISGNVGRITSNDTHYKESRVRCLDKKCKSLGTYYVNCMKRIVGLSAEIRMVDIAGGDIIYADTLSKTSQWSHCSDNSKALPSAEIAAQDLAKDIANEFTHKLTPHYRIFEVVLLEKPDIKYDSRAKKLLEVSLEYIKQNRFDKAQNFLIELIDETNEKSYVAFYNLGVVKEAQGIYSDAQQYYKIADSLMVEPVEEINKAYIRIQSLIEKNTRANMQLQK